MSFLKDWAAKPAAGGGNHIKDGRGTLIVKDIRLDKTFKDPRTFVIEFVVKESHAVRDDVAPNAPGTEVSFVKFLTKVMGEEARANAALQAIDPDLAALPADKLAATYEEIMRLDSDGYTKKGTLCDLRGVEVGYETYRKFTKDGKTELTIPKFKVVANTEEQVAANRKFIKLP